MVELAIELENDHCSNSDNCLVKHEKAFISVSCFIQCNFPHPVLNSRVHFLRVKVAVLTFFRQRCGTNSKSKQMWQNNSKSKHDFRQKVNLIFHLQLII